MSGSISLTQGDDRQLRRLGAGVTAVSLVLGAAGLVLLAIEVGRGWVPINDASTAEITVAAPIFVLAFPLLGWVVLRRVPGSRLGWTYAAVGFWEALNVFASGYSNLAYRLAAGNLPLASELSWVAIWAWVPAFTLFSTLGILLFPTGHLPSRRWWPVVALTVFAFVLLLVPSAIASWPYRGLPLERADALNLQPDNPVLKAAFAIRAVGQLVLLVAMFGSVAGLVARFRRSTSVERQQLKWFIYAAVLDVLIVVAWAGNAFNPLIGALSAVVFGLALPVAIGIAILRYRLYDIDRIISRTLGYTALTAALAIVYGAAFVGLQATLTPITSNGGSLAVAASTLVVLALFQPLRRRLQWAMDRRFNRSSYDASRIVEAFAERLRDEVDIEMVRAEVLATVDATVQPRGAAVWLREPTG